MTVLIDSDEVLGTPGPPGAGISSGQWSALQAIVKSDSTGDVDTGSHDLTVGGTATMNGDVNLGNSTGDTITVTGHVETAGSPPSPAANSAAGTLPTISLVFGNDTRGIIHLTTGTSPGTGNLFTITHAVARADANYAVVLTMVDDNSGALSATQKPYVNQAALATGFWTAKVAAALAASTSYYFQYVIFG